MLDFTIRLLSFLGIILLALILLLLAMLLLVLFFPVTYRLRGVKTDEKLELSAKVNWLFGFLRARYLYPEPGLLTVRLLWFKIYQTKVPPDGGDTVEPEGEHRKEDGKSPPGGTPESREDANPGPEPDPDARADADTESGTDDEAEGSNEAAGGQTQADEGQGKDRTDAALGQDGAGQEEANNSFFEKIKKIKYTICSIYDKIREIWKNISYYTALLREEDTRQLWLYVRQRVAKILKNIRPRHIRADILFGVDSPDKTGYLYGLYCMLSPFLGVRALMTPDFERAVLEGSFELSGHITVYVLAVNILKLILDKKLQMFIKKLKKTPQKGGASH